MKKNLKKLFWTWDHSTNWRVNVPGNQTCGAGNAYTKSPEAFLTDYRRSVDFCKEHGIDAIGIAGLLRDRHGGVDYARRVCEYAQENGIRIYLIAGLYAYGGIYHEGNHEFALDNFLENNPDCMGKNLDGSDLIFSFPAHCGHKVVRQGCPSNAKLHDYILRSIEWLFREIPELGGLQMETGDTGICMCEKCIKRRGGEVNQETSYLMSYEDMAHIYPDAVRVVKNTAKDAWAICETYHHFLPGEPESLYKFNGATPADKAALLQNIPDDSFIQWVCDFQIADGSWANKGCIPAGLQKYQHIIRAHHSTYWRGGRHALTIEAIRRHCYHTAMAEAQAVSMFGEGSPFHTNAELNYLALQYFANDPEATVEQFTDDVMAPRLGGKALAETYLRIAVEGKNEPEKVPGFSKEIANLLAGLQDQEAIRRWFWLASYLNSIHWESTQKGYVKRDDKLVVL